MEALVRQIDAEEGRLDLDATYGTYVDDGPRRGTVTLRQLLSHSSGIHNYFENRRYLDAKRDKLGHTLHHQDLRLDPELFEGPQT